VNILTGKQYFKQLSKILFLLILLPAILIGIIKYSSFVFSYKQVQYLQDLAEASEPNKRYINYLGMEFVWITPGQFMMGSPSTESVRDFDENMRWISIKKGYYIQTTEVTQGQWMKIMGSNPSYFKDCGDDCPVENVSWYDTQEFIKKLNSMGGPVIYRLPLETEWEYVARAGTTNRYSFGACISTIQVNYNGDNTGSWCRKGYNRNSTIITGCLPSNTWEMHDMHGNVWEWCLNWYKYPYITDTDTACLLPGVERVYRGGGWSSSAKYCRSANRARDFPDSKKKYLGFRLLGREAAY